MDTLPVRRIHVSSDFRVSGTPSNFAIRLSQSVQLPDDCVAYIDNITINNSFYTITTGFNDFLYVAEKVGTTVTCRSVQLPQGNYTLNSYAEALQTALRNGAPASIGTTAYTVTWFFSEGNIQISRNNNLFTFNILSDPQILAHDGSGGLTINKNNPRSGNKLISNKTNGNTSSNPQNYDYIITMVTGFMSFLPISNVFVHSNLADNCVMTPIGLGDCIACIPISNSFGNTVHHNLTSEADFINVSRKSFETLTFQLRDQHGNLLETNEGFFSASILFEHKI
jgi:hypothetical protein